MKKEAPDGLDPRERVRGKGYRGGSRKRSKRVTFSRLELCSLGRTFPAEPPLRIFPVEESRKGLAGGTYALAELPLVGRSR